MTNGGEMTDLVEAVQDLTRVTIALSGRFLSKADTIRQLIDLGIPPVRVASLLTIPPKQVHAELVKARHRKRNTQSSGGTR